VSVAKKECLNSCDMGETKSANLEHVIKGLLLSMVADLKMTKEDLLESITFKAEAPFLEFKAVEKF